MHAPDPRIVFDLLTQLVGGAALCIYFGAHSSLARPPSAAPNKASPVAGDDDDYEYDDDEADDEGDPALQAGLDASDAILLPLISALVLYGLYCLIMYLDDPEILNKIVRGYMSLVSLASIAGTYTQLLLLATNLVFPRFWRARGGSVYEARQDIKAHVPLGPAGPGAPQAFLLGPLPVGLRAAHCGALGDALWALRGRLTQKWMVRLRLRAGGAVAREKGVVQVQHVVAGLLSMATVAAYQMTNATALSNIIAVSLCHMTFTVLSPTTFVVGSMILTGLFFYDIIMVFYTPLMLTVASKLDAPVKLVASAGGKSGSMLGLGDIVLPGIMISMALRFDLWRHYHAKTKYETVPLMRTLADGTTEVAAQRTMATKPRYISVAHKWGDWLWTASFGRSADVPVALAGATFAKTYFAAAMVGYTLGLVAAMGFMLVFRHGQPALLYLVPAVLAAVWGTGWARSEIGLMLKYTEDGSLDTKEQIVEVDEQGRPVQQKQDDEEEKKKKTARETKDDKEVFVFSITEMVRKQRTA
ncbi:hypothetical protein TD95_002881 [Thielaviopsis punctulata]|uniref:Uncharacterized protein n=1 Tax=Thielaviopsis punctulata TaxID=72032 RepID=A0A0F4ZEG4_9PEZI|nr:hypothetical protein TD95_002881 [Thielaviopsis punctulata]